jgi:ABC-type bacteriocin/lantibiotic exporter with double-glycine peptidase domain
VRWRRRAIPYVAQAEMADCGAAALAMALAYHGRHVPLPELHTAAGTGRDGTDAAREAFRRRSQRITPLLAELADRGRRDLLTQQFPDLLHSFSHLNTIRLLRSAARTHELVLLSFLDRHYASQIARTPRQETV